MEKCIRSLLAYAVRAPSTHNSQPWRFRIRDNRCDIFVDDTSALKEADPINRDRTISIGCCIENLLIAGRAQGLHGTVTYAGDPHIATVSFTKGAVDANAVALIPIIEQRFNARGIFSHTPVPPASLATLTACADDTNVSAHIVTDAITRAQCARLTERGIHSAYARPLFRREIARWIRPWESRARDGLTGRALRMPPGFSLAFKACIPYINAGKKLGVLNYKSISSAPAICVLTTPRDHPHEWLDVGRVAQRQMLHAFANGLKTSIFVAAIEMGDLRDDLRVLLNTNTLPQFLFCIGEMKTPQCKTARYNPDARMQR
jgi:hypothetical protein